MWGGDDDGGGGLIAEMQMELGSGDADRLLASTVRAKSRTLNSGRMQLALAPPWGVILDLTPSPLLLPRFPSFRGESAAIGLLDI